MALSQATAQSFDANAPEISAVEIAENKAIFAYDSVGDSEIQAQVGDLSSGSLVLGTVRTVNGDRGDPHLAKVADNKALMAWRDDGDTFGKLRILNVSGTTISEQTAATIEAAAIQGSFMRTAVLSSGNTGLVAYRKGSGPYTHRLCRFSISGNTITPGTPQDHSDTGGIPIAMIFLNTTKVLYMYAGSTSGGGYDFQVIDISSSVSEGSVSRLSGAGETVNTRTAKHNLGLLDTNKAIAIYIDDDTTDTVSIVTVNTSGNNIDSFGTPTTLLSANNSQAPSLWPIGTDKAICIYRNGSSNVTRAETVTIDGDTITAAGDGINLSQANGVYGNVPVVVSTKAIAVWQNESTSAGYAAMITGVPAASVVNAKFYFGLGALEEKFTLPFGGVAPKGMTLDQSLGTVVLGSDTPDNQPVIYSPHPYTTGTASYTGFPTGSAITALKWV